MLHESSLNVDLLLEIFILIAGGQRASLLPVTLVNHDWHTVAQTIIDKTIDLTICSPYESRNLAVLKRLEEQAAFNARVQHLVIRDVHLLEDLDETPESSLQFQIDAVKMALDASQLRAFSWAAIPPLPQVLATALALKADIVVHIRLNSAAVDTAAWSCTPLANCKSLRRLIPLASKLQSLQLCLPDEDELCGPILRTLAELTKDCSQLKTLDLHALGRHSDARDKLRDVILAGHAEISYLATNRHEASPCTRLYEFWSVGLQPSQVSQSLTSLKLENLCACDLDQHALSAMRQLPHLQSLQVSCLRLLKHMSNDLVELRSLTLTLVGRDAETITSPIRVQASAPCVTLWPENEVGNTLRRFQSLTELRVFGNVEAVSIATLLCLKDSLRRLVLLPDAACTYQATTTSHREPFPRRFRLPDFLSMLGAACPHLEELTCDAPNASAEFDVYLESITTSLRSLKQLSIHRSLEPYGNVLLANKLSYARFTRSSVIVIWRLLRTAMPLQTMSISLGNVSHWDSRVGSTKICPATPRRNFVVQSTVPWNATNLTDKDHSLTYREHEEAWHAIIEQRPGPSSDYWQVQSRVAEEFAEERNVPLFPRQHLREGVEFDFRMPRPAPSAFSNPAWLERRRQRRQMYNAGLQAQHDLELQEAMRPSRIYY